jgi:hypothetical protein
MIVRNYIPDVRKAVNTLQKSVVKGKLKAIDVNSIVTVEKNICGLLVQICDNMGTKNQESTNNRSVPEIIKLLAKGEPDYRGMYATLSNLEGLPLWAKITVNKYANNHQGCAIPNIHFMSMIYEVIVAGMSYYSMFKR